MSTAALPEEYTAHLKTVHKELDIWRLVSSSVWGSASCLAVLFWTLFLCRQWDFVYWTLILAVNFGLVLVQRKLVDARTGLFSLPIYLCQTPLAFAYIGLAGLLGFFMSGLFGEIWPYVNTCVERCDTL